MTPAAAIALALAASIAPSTRAELRARPEIGVRGFTIARFAQVHEGIPVADAGITFVADPSGAIIHRGIRLMEEFPSARPTLDAHAAARIAYAAAGPFPWDESRARLWFVSHPRGTRLSWRLSARVPEMLPTRPVALIDAHDGTLLRLMDEARDAGLTLAYADNPVATPALEKVPLPLLPDGAKTLASPELEARSCIDRRRVKSFDGREVHVCDVEPAVSADASGDFLVAPPDDPGAESPFAETQVFFHAAKVARWVRDDLGIDVVPKSTPLRLITNVRWPPGWTSGDASKIACAACALEPISNAFFAPGEVGGPGPLETLFETRGDAMWFGLGPRRSWAVDGDVVYHEYTHVLVQHTIAFVASPRVDDQGVSFAPSAMNEAMADYVAAAVAGAPQLGEWIGADLDPPRALLRDLSLPATCPSHLVGEPHFDSLLLSTALHRARVGLADAARRELDRAVLTTLAAGHRGDLAFEELAAMLVDTTQKIASSALADALRQELSRAGILPRCERVVELSGTTPASAISSFGWIAPGRKVVGVAGVVPPVIQFRRALPSGAVRAEVRFALPPPFRKSVDLDPPTGRPFAPRVVARFDGPVRYLPSGARAQGAFDVQGAIEIPRGARALFVAIESNGDVDGNYDRVAVITDVDEGAPTPTSVTGGGCAMGSHEATSDAWLVLVALITSRAWRSRR